MENNNKPISDELIAAYLEGKATKAEILQVLQALKTDPVLRETLSIALEMGNEEMTRLPAMQMAAESGENLCSVICEAYILSRRGVSFDEEKLLATSRENHWLNAQGTPLHSIGQLLAYEGLHVTRKYDATVEDLAHILRLDNDVIVALDRDKLYPELPDEEDAANHAVVVTDIDLETQTISLYDPPQLSSINFQLSTFENAWKESQHYMVRVLQMVEEYEPQPVDLENILLGEELNELI